jgi:heme/copper-type cytochrome/quinol oxidase subunit 2
LQTGESGGRKTVLAAALVLGAVAAGALLAVFFSDLRTSPTQGSSTTYPPYTNLPADCKKPEGGFLVIANENGYNDSSQHGALLGTNVSWPIITVHVGDTVDIVVCNADTQPHGFQVTGYFIGSKGTVAPGKVIQVSFLASKAGDYRFYCQIFCSVHFLMQKGLLRVLP